MLVMSGCSTVSDPADLTLLNYGAISVQATHGDNGTGKAVATAIFFAAYAASIPDSRTPANYCQFSTVDTTTSPVQGETFAGASLGMLFGRGAGSSSATLPYDAQFKRYASTVPNTYVTGDSVKVMVPGDTSGFPGAMISVRLAEPLAPEPFVLPPAGSPLTVRWNASPDSTTAILLSLKYANPASSPYPNEQIFCSLKDDGSEVLSAVAMGPVLASPAAMRSLQITRWRTQIATPNAASLLHIVSSIDTLIKLQ
jgi:hypothetical protein